MVEIIGQRKEQFSIGPHSITVNAPLKQIQMQLDNMRKQGGEPSPVGDVKWPNGQIRKTAMVPVPSTEFLYLWVVCAEQFSDLEDKFATFEKEVMSQIDALGERIAAIESKLSGCSGA